MLGIIGGSGLYNLDVFNLVQTHAVPTPFGEASAEVVEVEASGNKIFFLPRHGTSHQYLPHEINYRANIYALKSLGVNTILSVSAVGSLQEEIAPGSFVLPNQFIDFTKKRTNSFLGEGLVAHVSSADPVCPLLADQIIASAKQQDIALITDKTYVCIEGPRFGTRSESHMFRAWGADIIGMTNVPEVFLAREAQISYASFCVATDYDCWREGESVNIDEMLDLYKSRLEVVKSFLSEFISSMILEALDESPARCSLDSAVLGVDTADQGSLKVFDLLKT